MPRILPVTAVIICSLWLQGFAVTGSAWGPADDALLGKLAAAKNAEELKRLIEENESTVNGQWLYDGAVRAYGLESNYSDDTGLRMTAVIRDIARSKGLPRNEAVALYERGGIQLDYKYGHAAAEKSYTDALGIFRTISSWLWQARCINRLGDLAFQKSDYRTADDRFQEALALYRKAGSLFGEANCTKRFGDLSLQVADYPKAETLYQQALPLYRKLSSPLGEANCLKRLGDISFNTAAFPPARERYGNALALYTQAGSSLGEANCMKMLAEIAFTTKDPVAAEKLFRDALARYRKVKVGPGRGLLPDAAGRPGARTERPQGRGEALPPGPGPVRQKRLLPGKDRLPAPHRRALVCEQGPKRGGATDRQDHSVP